MPPRSRTQPPASRRPRVAGLRDPRRHQDVDEDASATQTAAAPTADAASSSARADRTEALPTTGAVTTEERPADSESASPAEATPTAERTAPVSLDKTSIASPTATPTRQPVKESAPTPAAEPTPAARPTPTGRATTRRRRPAPATGAAAKDTGTRRHRSSTRSGPWTAPRWLVPVLAVAVVVLLVAAGVLGYLGHRNWTSPDSPTSNGAVVDAAATAEVVGQTRQGIEQVFSFDPAKIDDSPQAARNLGTGDFPREYVQVFDQTVRQAAVSQGLRQTATVLNIGVRSIRDDQANVIVLIQLDVQRATTGQSSTTPGLLNVDLQRVDNQWKLAKVSPLTGKG